MANKYAIHHEKVETIGDLYEYLYDGPIYAYYNSRPTLIDGKPIAHLVVVVGADIDQDLVYINNPWGVGGSQSFSEFQNGVLSYNGETNTIMKMKGIYLIE